jgi:hypothetical protein
MAHGNCLLAGPTDADGVCRCDANTWLHENCQYHYRGFGRPKVEEIIIVGEIK